MNNKKKKEEAALLTAAAYQPGQVDVVERIRSGLAQASKGEGRPADDVFDELERKDPSR